MGVGSRPPGARTAKPRPIELEAFTPAQLEQLAGAYSFIRARLEELERDELCAVKLPPARPQDQRLEELRRLAAAGELVIRISARGNLYVLVRSAIDFPDEGNYFTALRVPARIA